MLNATFLAALAFAPQSAGQTPPQDDSPLAIDLDAETPAPRFEASGWNVDIGGTLKVGLLASEDVKFYSDAGMAGVSIGAARLWFESELPDHWRVHFGLRGERGNARLGEGHRSRGMKQCHEINPAEPSATARRRADWAIDCSAAVTKQ